MLNHHQSSVACKTTLNTLIAFKQIDLYHVEWGPRRLRCYFLLVYQLCHLARSSNSSGALTCDCDLQLGRILAVLVHGLDLVCAGVLAARARVLVFAQIRHVHH